MRPVGVICNACWAASLGSVPAPVPAPIAIDSELIAPISGSAAPAPVAAAPIGRVAAVHRAQLGLGRPRPAVHRGRAAPTGPSPSQAPVAVVEPEQIVLPAPAPVARAPSGTTRRSFRPIDIWKRYLPPVRLVWLFLGVLVWHGGGFLSAVQALPLVAIPILGVVTDLGFQRIRFPRLRFPDAALATSLFLVLIVWPATLDMALTSIVVAAVGLRHILRIGGHPLVNPAAMGLTIATVLFALPTSWHVGATLPDAALIVIFGAVLVARAPHTWRIPVFYFLSFLPLTAALSIALGAGSQWTQLMLTGALSPASVFFGMFMATEPRTAPSARKAMIAFAILVGVASAGLPVLFAEFPTIGALGVLGPFLALFIGNLFTLALPSARGGARPSARPTPRPSPGRGLVDADG